MKSSKLCVLALAIIALPILIQKVLAAPPQKQTPLEQPQLITLPDIGDATGTLMSPQEEQKLGEAFMRSVRRTVSIVDDPDVEEYIQALGYRLVANADSSIPQFNFFVVNDASVNAFAGPGGYIGVHTGLIMTTQTESELASVIAHEIAHVTQHHLLRGFDNSRKINIPATAAVIAALILGGSNPQIGEAAVASAFAASKQLQINFTRENEAEADRIGMHILAGASFNPRSMPDFFEQLQSATRYYESKDMPDFLRTHPVTTSRIADTRNRAEQYPRQKVTESLSFELIRAKLKVLTATDPASAVNYFSHALADNRDAHSEANQYGLALALLAADKHDVARKHALKLLEKEPNNVTYLIALAKIESAADRDSVALKIFADTLKIYPRNYPLTITYASALLQNGQASKARQLLQEYLRYRDPKPLLYQYLAQADSDAGFPIESQQALAEFAYLNGQLHVAVEHLQRALKQTKSDDFYRASRIESRLKEIQREVALEMNP